MFLKVLETPFPPTPHHCVWCLIVKAHYLLAGYFRGVKKKGKEIKWRGPR